VNEDNRSSPTEVLIFEVGGQRYGLPSSTVKELVRAVAVVPLPKAPAIIEGVINLRGTLVPVLNIRARFRLPMKSLEHTDHFIVGWSGERLVALRVDRAIDLVQVNADDFQDAKGVVPGAEYVAWLAKLSEDLVVIHDLPTFLSRDESAALTEALAESRPFDSENILQ
jgi:purine-binding chemotaxis protein CheW